MSTNYHDPIEVGESNSPATVNTRFSTIDTELTALVTAINAAKGIYADINTRFNSLVLAGGNISTLVNGAVLAGATTVNVDSSAGFINSARVAYPLLDGTLEYNTIDNINSATQIALDDVVGTGGIANNALFTMISESEYQAGQALIAAVAGVPRTLPDAIRRLEREINVKAFGAIGDGSSHLVGGGAALAAAQARYPLTHAAHTITAADQYDWCAIQEAILRADEIGAPVENVYIPAGSYMVNRTITVPFNPTDDGRTFTIYGAGYRGTPTSGTMITLTANTTLFLIPGQTALRDMTLVGNTYTNSASIGIRIGGRTTAGDPWEHANCVHVVIDRVRFDAGWYRCISSLYECDQLQITHCTCYDTVGQAVVYLSNDHPTNGVSPSAGMVIEQCSFASTGSTLSNENLYGIYLYGTENSAVRNSVIRGYDHIVYLFGSSGVRNYGLTIDGLHSEISQNLKSSTSNRWTPNTAYALNALVRPHPTAANGWWYRCTTAGTTAATSIRTAAYRWVASARGTNEYYCELAAGGNPSLAQPHGVTANGVPLQFGWAGRLGAGQWGYGNNDGLGGGSPWDTIYVRLSDGTDPDTKGLHYVWTNNNEPTWPTTYGATVVDGSVTWTAYKRSVFLETAAVSDAIHGGLRIQSTYAENFAAFIWTATGTSSRIAVDNCSIISSDMIYTSAANTRHSLILENSYMEGTIRPYATTAATNAQTSVLARFCDHNSDLLGLLGNSINGVTSWFTQEPNYNRSSEIQVADTNYVVNPFNDNLILVSAGSSATNAIIYLPRIPTAAWFSGLKGKEITVVKVDGTDSVVLTFLAAQYTLTGGAAAATLTLADVGDSVTLRLGVSTGTTVRWVIAGSHGI